MNGLVDLGDLQMLVLSNLAELSPQLLQRAKAVVEDGENLQRKVFNQQGVSFPEQRILPAEDSIGGPGTSAQLDGSSPTYHQLYLLRNNQLIGFQATEELEVEGLGNIIFQYFPPLIPKEEANVTYTLIRAALAPGRKKGGGTVELTPADALLAFSKHRTMPLDEFVATLTDGIGVDRPYLARNGFLRSETAIWVPPLDAGTHEISGEDSVTRFKRVRDEYMTVLPEPVYMHAKFADDKTDKLARGAATWLFITNYLKEACIDKGKLRSVETKARNQIMREQGHITEEQLTNFRLRVDELPSVIRTKESIAEASGNRGYVALWPVDPTR